MVSFFARCRPPCLYADREIWARDLKRLHDSGQLRKNKEIEEVCMKRVGNKKINVFFVFAFLENFPAVSVGVVETGEMAVVSMHARDYHCFNWQATDMVKCF